MSPPTQRRFKAATLGSGLQPGTVKWKQQHRNSATLSLKQKSDGGMKGYGGVDLAGYMGGTGAFFAEIGAQAP